MPIGTPTEVARSSPVALKMRLLEVSVSGTRPELSQGYGGDESFGLGLPGQHERIESLGGHLQVASSKDQGRCILMQYQI